MPAYVVAIRERIRHQEDYARYKELAPESFCGFSPKRLSSQERFEVLEGADATKVTILEFPTFDEARQWYFSPAYQKVLDHRLRGADFRFILVDGPEAD